MTVPIGLPEPLQSDWPYIFAGCDGNIEIRGSDSRLVEGPVPPVAEVVEAWWSFHDVEKDQEPGTELSTYGVVRFEDGRWGYFEAWNDYTGWGCQDGVAWRICDTPEQLDFFITDEGRGNLTWRAEAKGTI